MEIIDGCDDVYLKVLAKYIDMVLWPLYVSIQHGDFDVCSCKCIGETLLYICVYVNVPQGGNSLSAIRAVLM